MEAASLFGCHLDKPGGSSSHILFKAFPGPSQHAKSVHVLLDSQKTEFIFWFQIEQKETSYLPAHFGWADYMYLHVYIH